MNLILEITKPDGSVVLQPVDTASARIDTQPGEHFRLIDTDTGLPPADLTAKRDGDNLVIEGLPEQSALQLCDFYKHGEDSNACTLGMETSVAPNAEAMMLAQTSTAAPTPVPTAPPAGSDTAAANSSEAVAAASNPAFTTTGIALGAIGLVGVAAAAGGSDDDDAQAPAPAPGPSPEPPPAPAPGPSPEPPPAPAPSAPPAPTGVTSEGADDIIGVGERLPEASGGNVGETGTIDFVGGAGSAEAGATVTLDLQSGGSSVLNAPVTTTAAADGSFTVSVPAGEALALASGVYTPVVTQTNANGTSAAATVNDITVLPTSPSSVSIEGGDTTVTAAEAAGGIEISGTTEAGATVDVVMWDVGFNNQLATAQATADGSGNFTATIAEADALAAGNGTYTLQTTTTTAAGASDFPNSSPITLDFGVSVGSGQTGLGGDATVITGDAGNEVLIGDYGGSVRNGSFEFWDTTAASTYDATVEGGLGAFSTNSGNGANLGWTMVAGATEIDHDADPLTQQYFNLQEGSVNQDGRVQLVANTVGGGETAWDTASDNFYAGGGVTQTIQTVSGTDYSLVISVDSLTTGEDTMLQVSWGGTVIAERQPDGSWTGSNPPVEGVPGAETDYTFSGLSATAATTELTINAFERYYDASNAAVGDGGDNNGLNITGVSLSTATADGDDTISGGDGADLIYGQGGSDLLYGGADGAADTAADTFVYSMQMDNGNDIIMDFDAANGDQIQLVDVINAVSDANDVAQAQGASSDGALTFDDLTAVGTQNITVADDGNGNVQLVFSNTDGGLGSAVLTGLTFGTGAGEYDTVADLTGANILLMTGDGFNTGL